MRKFEDRGEWIAAATAMGLRVEVQNDDEMGYDPDAPNAKMEDSPEAALVALDADGDAVGLWGWWNVERKDPSGLICENEEEVGDVFGN